MPMQAVCSSVLLKSSTRKSSFSKGIVSVRQQNVSAPPAPLNSAVSCKAGNRMLKCCCPFRAKEFRQRWVPARCLTRVYYCV